ncbi:NAD(P)/FAD-dependent oxidoreductase [Mycolicibacterium fluoranthenivorans]|uniref:NADH dehydrogenase FAD-containing subunit n=1 Tax=Mycolicibacterium fluoranthenivorans TaxID=258505 RepID=A0A7X5U5R9_9MYCO|nr:FAD-dependent oxidoreductase [Mycolicibacterium fluoranthenivorans]MCV7354554.1 FAD-dependent oxidoreductase [Mycolicibacterium fluoranthenivorans]NIH98837.1 NADH dehydrogenase FAD-containing subunit [Mycolicibacterium fluoranthenivorans]
MTENNATQKVIVLGGGYAGVLAANHLLQRPGVKVTLVNARPEFVERIRLHQLVAGTHDATADYDELLSDKVTLVVDTAERIDTAARRVELASGNALDYDYLIYAVGSTSAGAPEFAYALSELEDAQRLRARLQDVPMSAPIVVVGGGLTGIEAASEFAEAGRTTTLVAGPALGPSLGAQARRSAAKQLAKLGVTVIVGPTVAAVHADHVELSDGRLLRSATTVWTVGFGVSGLAARSGLRTDDLGRLLTDETLVSIDDDRVVGAGDAVAPSGSPLRMSCQAAMPLAAQAARTVLARIDGGAPQAINQAFAGQCVSIGRSYGTIQISRPDDSPRRAYVGGRIAASIKEMVCKGTLWQLRREAAKPGSYFLIKGGKRAERLAALLEHDPA